jgi:hypothetical protein
MIRHCLQIFTIILAILLPGFVLNATASPPLQVRVIAPFDVVTDNLDADNLAHDWTFSAQQDQYISITADRVSGDLDVVIELRNAAGQLLAANDNATFDTTNARLEAIRIPNDDYVIRVYREGLEAGITSGTYELQLLRGYSVPYTDLPAATTTEDTARQVVEFPAAEFFITADVQLPTDTPDYTLQWRIEDPTAITWVFEHDVAGNWRLAIENARGELLRSTDGTSEQLDVTAGNELNLYLWRQVTGLYVLANGVNIATITPVENLSLTLTGSLQVVPLDPDAPLTLISNFRLTTAFYDDAPTTAGAITPTPPGERIYDFLASPGDILEQLRAIGFAPPPTESSGLQGSILSSFILNDAASFNAYPLIERPFQNFVLSFTAQLQGGTDGSACGMIFRQVSPATFATILFTPDRGLYALQYEDGVLQAGGVATISPALLPGKDIENNFIAVANAGTATVFVNGRLVAEVPITERAGLTLSHLALDADLATFCQLNNLWLWALD